MTYAELDENISEAWDAFFFKLRETSGTDLEKLDELLELKDIYYPIQCAVVQSTDLESEEDE